MRGRWPSAALIGLAALILAVAGLVAAATHDSDEEMARGAAPMESTTSLPEPTSASSTSTTLTTTVPAVPATTSGSPSTTVRRGVTTTVARGTTTSRPASPTTSATAPPCTAAQIEITADTEKASYARNEKVKVDSTLRNRSADTCFFVSYSFSASFRDPRGEELNAYNSNPPGSPNRPFAPGQIIRASATWDPLACPDPICFAAPAGDYSVLVTWGFPGGPYTALRPFART